MANSQALATSFKVELLNGHHAFGTSVVRGATTKDTFKAALFYASASLGAGTTAYSTTGEVVDASYTAGGVTVTNATAPTSSGTTAYWTPSAAFSWTALTAAAFDAVLVYNSTQSNKAVGVFTFGSQSVTAGNFSLNQPTNDSSNALIRLT
jgi:hypothetical protein